MFEKPFLEPLSQPFPDAGRGVRPLPSQDGKLGLTGAEGNISNTLGSVSTRRKGVTG